MMEFKKTSIFFFVLIASLPSVLVSDLQQDIDEGTCSRETCSKSSAKSRLHDGMKYKTENGNVRAANNEQKVDDELSVEQKDDNNEGEELQEEGVQFINYDFPPLIRIDPGKVGDEVEIELEPGKFYKRITRSVNPPIFEIPNYLSSIESNRIISAALDAGLERSGVVGADIEEERTLVNDISEMSRVSEQTWVSSRNLPLPFYTKLQNRLSKLTQIPLEQLQISEEMQVVSYVRGGHYHAHIDSTDTTNRLHLPCCFQTPECLEIDIHDKEFEECCRICRYMTVLYYLNDVDEGGQTAFPLADMPDDLFKEKYTKKDEVREWQDLSHYCNNASVVVSPKRGSAIMWYNHLLDENGYLGHVDMRSHHGGCDIIKGTKWIANNWISATNYKDRTKPSMIY